MRETELGKMKKGSRLLDLNLRFAFGEVINKKAAAADYQVNERTVQRDIETIRNYYAEKYADTGERKELVYNRALKGYQLTSGKNAELTGKEVYAISKILLESKAFTKEEMLGIQEKLMNTLVIEEERNRVKKLLLNETFYYVPPQHNRALIEDIWKLGRAVTAQQKVKIRYRKMDGQSVERRIKPVGILFSEYYFYLMALWDNSAFEKEEDAVWTTPTIYRIDRILTYEVLKEHFAVPYKERFQEGEFRKKVQFMYGGKLQKIRFEYRGPSVESVLDRIPTAVIEHEEEGVYTVSAEVIGPGIHMWLRSQGDKVTLL